MSRVSNLRAFLKSWTRMPKLLGVSLLERALAHQKSVIHAQSISPERFFSRRTSQNLFPRMLRNVRNYLSLMDWWKSASVMASIADNIWHSFTSLTQNPVQPKKRANVSFFEELENYAKGLGIGAMGYTQLPPEYIFRDKAVLFEHVLVLLMEMDREKIDLAPSVETRMMVMETYDLLGIAANELSEFLRHHGYAAQAGHPLGGLVLYPPLAKMAGLGWHGRHGLLITPEFGPRVRIATIFTSIENLPRCENNPHKWVEEYCYARCGDCIRECPPKAIFENPIVAGPKLLTHIDNIKCLPYFAEHHGCSICIKVCPFSSTDYQDIRQS